MTKSISLEVGKRYKFCVTYSSVGSVGREYVYCIDHISGLLINGTHNLVASIVEIEKKINYWLISVNDIEYL